MKKGFIVTAALAMVLGVGVAVSAHQPAVKGVGADATIDIYFTRPNSDWYNRWHDKTPNIYYWGGASSPSWPGVAMTDAYVNSSSEHVFKYSLPADATAIIFNSDGDQTVNIESGINDRAGFYLNGGNSGSRTVGSWEVKFYTINYNANGGSGTMESDSAVCDVSWGLKANSFTKDGYMFAGWNTAADGTGTPYSNQQLIDANTFETHGDHLDLYAQWVSTIDVYFSKQVWGSSDYDGAWNQDKRINVHYWGAGFNGEVEMNHAYNDDDSHDIVKAAIPSTATGLLFKGEQKEYTWDQTADITSGIANKKGFYLTGGDWGSRTVDSWDVKFYTINYNANTGTGTMASDNAVCDVTWGLKANEFTKDGYVFFGWNTAADGTGTPYSGSASIEKNTYTVDGSSVTLYAQWDIVSPDGCFLRGSFNNWKNANQVTMTEVETNKYRGQVALTAGARFQMVFSSSGSSTWCGLNSAYSLDATQYPVSADGDNVIVTNAATYRVTATLESTKWNYEVAAVEAVADGAYLRGDWTNGWTTAGQVSVSESAGTYSVSNIALSAGGKIKMVQFKDGIVSWCSPKTVTGTESFPASKVDDDIQVTKAGVYAITITYSEGWVYSLVGSLDPSLDIAEAFADDFNTKIGAICVAYGSTNVTNLVNEWKTQRANFNAITDSDAKDYISNPPGTSVKLTNFEAKYVKVYSTYKAQIDAACDGNGNFANLPTASAPIVNNFATDSTNNITIVAIVAITAISASLVLVLIRKRKHQ